MSGVIVGAAKKLARAKRLWFLWWAAQTVLALLVSLPLTMMLARYLGHSRWAEELVTQFEISVIAELAREYSNAANLSTPPVLAVAAIAAILTQVLLSAGVISWLRQGEDRPVVREVLRAGAQWFWPMLRLTVWALIGYALILILDALLFARFARKLAEGMEAKPVWILLHIRVAVAAVLAACLNVMTDYGRVRMIALERRSAWRALAWSRGFVFGHLGRVAPVWLTVGVFMALLFAAKTGLDWVIPATSTAWILLGVLIQQAYIVSRIWTKLMLWASANEVYSDLNPPYRPVVEAPVEVEGLA